MRTVTVDVDAYLDLRVDARRLETLTAELALLFVNVLRYQERREEECSEGLVPG